MRLTGGIVRVPVRYLYLSVVILCIVFYSGLELSKYQIRKHQALCRADQRPRKPKAQAKALEGGPKNHLVCSKEPVYTSFDVCPHCFRPNIQNLSRQIQLVPYDRLMLPRGPPGIFKLRDKVQQEFIQNYLITPSTVCVDSCPYLVAIQLSATDQVEQRDAIRMTWASAVKTHLWPSGQLNADVQLIFVLAHQTELSKRNIVNDLDQPIKFVDKEQFPTVREWARIKAEADLHGDILYLDMQDSYFNLTLKLMSAFKWVSYHCARTKFFLKVDMDTFVNVPLLLDLLIFNEERLEFSITGTLYIAQRSVMRTEKWAVDPQVYPLPFYPIYASGIAYVLSTNSFSRMIEIAPFVPFSTWDVARKAASNISSASEADLFVSGILSLVLSCDFFDGGHFFTSKDIAEWSWCDLVNDRLVIARIDESSWMHKMWRSFVRFYKKCWKDNPHLANPAHDT